MLANLGAKRPTSHLYTSNTGMNLSSPHIWQAVSLLNTPHFHLLIRWDVSAFISSCCATLLPNKHKEKSERRGSIESITKDSRDVWPWIVDRDCVATRAGLSK